MTILICESPITSRVSLDESTLEQPIEPDWKSQDFLRLADLAMVIFLVMTFAITASHFRDQTREAMPCRSSQLRLAPGRNGALTIASGVGLPAPKDLFGIGGMNPVACDHQQQVSVLVDSRIPGPGAPTADGSWHGKGVPWEHP
jgi:hypothetical protein